MGLLGLVLALQACTGIQLGYNNAVNLAVWWLDGYVDLDKAQTQQLRGDLRQWQARHRTQVLPAYTQTLEHTQVLVRHTVDATQVCAVGSTVRGYVTTLLADTEPAATALVHSLSPAQIDTLERKYAKTNAEYRSDWLALAPAERTQKRFDKALERAEMVYGRMDAAQKTLIRQQVEQSGFDPQQVYTERLRRQTDTLQTLRQLQRDAADTATVRSALRGLLERSIHAPPPSPYRAYAEALAQQDCQGIALLHNSTTPKQRDAAVRWLAGYAQALRALAAQG
jgi:hypothetical protein